MKKICGLDECGRGALAGPLVAVATIFNSQFPISNLKDSKKLTAMQRKKIYQKIVVSGAIVEVEKISARQINNRGMGWANKEIFRRLILKIQADKYIVDGNLKIRVRGKSKQIKSVIDADEKIPEVMAASIIAKVTRDKIMRQLSEKHKNYGWNSNKGYGTKYHILSLIKYGRATFHRTLFVNTVLKNHKN